MKKQIAGFTLIFLQCLYFVPNIFGQIVIDPAVEKVEPKQIMPEVNLSIWRYLDQTNGTTADEAVRIALENNGELKALRDELEATRAQIRQAELRPNPRLMVEGSLGTFTLERYSAMAQVTLPFQNA